MAELEASQPTCLSNLADVYLSGEGVDEDMDRIELELSDLSTFGIDWVEEDDSSAIRSSSGDSRLA